MSEWIEYLAEHTPNWIQLRHSLANTKCSDRPGGIDNLLNLYDMSGEEYSSFQQFVNENVDRRMEQKKYEILSKPLDCLKKANSGLASFFSSSRSTRIEFSTITMTIEMFILLNFIWV